LFLPGYLETGHALVISPAFSDFSVVSNIATMDTFHFLSKAGALGLMEVIVGLVRNCSSNPPFVPGMVGISKKVQLTVV
jgi:hypothetical protein